MNIETYAPRIPHPQMYLNRPVRVRGKQVGRVTKAEYDTKTDRVKLTAVVDDALAPILVHAPTEVSIDGLRSTRRP